MQISTIIVAEGICPDIHLSIGSAQIISSEVIVVDIGIATEVREKIRSERPDVIFTQMEKPEYVELIRQQTFAFARYPWILLLDPDEYLSPELVKFIQETHEDESHTHFKIPRQNYIFGKWIAHSRWWPDYQVRLFRADSASWPTTLHGQPKLTGKGYIVGAFEDEKLEMSACVIVHHNYVNIQQFLEKSLRYARIDAQEMAEKNQTFTIHEACKRATGEFISRFFADRGYKDGVHGLILALLQMFYYILVFCYVWEKNGYQPVTQTQVMRAVKQIFMTTSREAYYWMSRGKIVKGLEAFTARIKSKIL